MLLKKHTMELPTKNKIYPNILRSHHHHILPVPDNLLIVSVVLETRLMIVVNIDHPHDVFQPKISCSLSFSGM